MFAKIVGRRTTALATTLAVVVGLAITPAFTATAAEGDEPVVVEAPVAEAPVAEPVEAPPVEAPAVEPPLVEASIEEAPRQELQSLMSAEAPMALLAAASLPEIRTVALPDATAGVSYSQTLDATTDPVPGRNTFSVVAGQLPPGLSLDKQTGEIRGTVSVQASGRYDFSITLAIKGQGNTVTTSVPRALSITVGYPAPVINPETLPLATVGLAYAAPALTAVGQGTITWSASGLPAGLSIDSVSGVISGTPQYNPAYGGVASLVITVTASNGRDSARAFTMTVYTPIPQFGAGTLPNATVGVPYDTSLGLQNAFGTITFTLESGTLPAGLQLTADGRIAGTPAYDAGAGASKYVEVQVRAQGTAGGHSKRFNFNVITPAPLIDTMNLADGWWKQAYSQVVEWTGPGVVVSVTGLPNGLRFDGTSITGATRATGDHQVTITATNSAGTVDRKLTLSIHAKPNLHRMPVVQMPTGEHFWGYPGLDGHQVTLTLGADAPAGMTLGQGNLLEWTPTAPGVYRFTIEANNPAGTDIQGYTFKVFDLPVITQGDLEAGVIGMAYKQKLDHDGTRVAFSVVRGDLPDGLKLTKAGVLKGTPIEAGTFRFKVRAKNEVGVDSKWFTLTVLQPATTLSSSNVIRGNSVTVSGSGYLPGDDLELWLHSTPVLLGKVTATNGTFTTIVVIPANTEAGAHHLVVTGARSGTQSMPLTIALPAAAQQPQSTTPTQRPVLTVTPAQTEVAATEAATGSEPEAGEVEEADEELPTLNKPVAEAETPAAVPANWTGLMVAAFVLLLAALLVWFLVWRRRRAADS